MNIYLDYQATTPADPAVVAAMEPFWTGKFGNPHSNHRYGWEAEAAVDVARTHISRLLNIQPESVVFTSGATEANNLALKGVMARAGRRRLVTVATEHSCVLESARYLETRGFDLTVLGVGPDGLIDFGALEAALGPDVALVSVMAVNNEIGVIQQIAEIAAARMGEDAAHAEALWDAFLAALHVPHAINGSTAHRWHGNINLRFEGLDGDRLIADLRRLSISSGAACASAKGRHSHVLEALGLSRKQAKASLRIGWGRFSTDEEVRAAAAMIGDAVLMQRRTAA